MHLFNELKIVTVEIFFLEKLACFVILNDMKVFFHVLIENVKIHCLK